MSNLEKYEQAFIQAFGVSREELSGLEYQGIDAWDSVGHMGLIEVIEDTFDIMMEADDIIELSSYEKGREILKKYKVEL